MKFGNCDCLGNTLCLTSLHSASSKHLTLDDAFSVLDGTSLLDRWQFRMLFPEAEILPETVMGMTKSLIAIHGS